MPYIGTSPSNGVRRVYTYTATASQTTFSGASNEGSTLAYVDNNYLDVYQNGILLGSADYTSTTGTSVVLAQAASVDDIIVIVAYDVFSVADTVSKTDGGTFDGNVTMGGTLDVSGAFTSQGIDDNADATAITIDSSERVGIKSTSPTNALQVVGTVKASSQLYVGSDSDDNYSGGVENLSNTSRSIGIKADPTNSGSASLINFEVDGTERARITDGGVVNLGTNGSYSGFIVQSTTGGADSYRATTNGGIHHFKSDVGGTNTLVSYINQTGGLISASDYRLKENVVDLPSSLETIKALRPVNFNFKNETELQSGFIAHELKEQISHIVDGDKDQVKEDGSMFTQMVDYSSLIPHLTKALQEATAKIEALEVRVTALENAE